ncbi:MAG TPA: PPOX class F420-dependent oxidoreductase [Thermomicrobiales bacterium]|jgi:PPOX class probable F420-dependent enzyme|nr:PPOX class F420-dependent oxidoreductase [Thermomicrobiales bacterium]
MQATFDQAQAQTAPALRPFVHQQTVLLTSYRRNGTPVGTPVSIAVDGDHAYVRTYESAWKFKRIRRNPDVEIAPSTLRGKPTGPALPARVRILSGEEAARASRAIVHKHPILHGALVPLYHRLNHLRTVHLELRPIASK